MSTKKENGIKIIGYPVVYFWLVNRLFLKKLRLHCKLGKNKNNRRNEATVDFHTKSGKFSAIKAFVKPSIYLKRDDSSYSCCVNMPQRQSRENPN